MTPTVVTEISRAQLVTGKCAKMLINGQDVYCSPNVTTVVANLATYWL